MVNLSIDKILAEEAWRLGINISDEARRALKKKVRHLRRQEQKNNEGQEVPASSIMER